MEKEEYAEILLDTGVVKLNPAKPFVYDSGMISPVYTSARAIISFPRERRDIVSGLEKAIERTIRKKKVNLIVGASSSAISLAAYLAERFHLPMAYARDEKKAHGKGKMIEGVIPKNPVAVVVADIMSTELTTPNAITALKELGCQIAFCVTITTNELNIVESFLQKEGIPYASLTNLSTITYLARMKGIISGREKVEIEEWLKNPEDWAKNREKSIKERKGIQARRIAEILLNIKAISINAKNPFRYVSGIYSPIYTDNRVLISHPDEWEEVMTACMDTAIEEVGAQNIDIIAGTATAGIPHAAYLGSRHGIPLVYVRPIKHEDGTKTYEVEGVIPKDARVLLIEDLISTGSSVLGSVDAVREVGGVVKELIVIFTYQMSEALEKFKEKDVTVYPLTDITTLLDVAQNTDLITAEDAKEVSVWMGDKKGWGEKKGFK